MVSSSAEHKETFTTKRGIVLELSAVSRYLVMDINSSMPLPKPPIVMIEEKGRSEENPNDPDYIEALRQANFKKGMAVSNAYLALGTKVVTLPDDIESVESEDWSDILTELGVKIPIKGRARYVAWLRYYAVPGDDFEALITATMREGSVTTESDVKKAEDSFRGDASGDAPTGVPTES
jgi:hypothetical protein